MSRYRRVRLALLAGALLVAGAAGAQDATLRAEPEATRVGVDDRFRLTVTLEGRNLQIKDEIAPPELTNLRILAPPSVSTQVSIVNGSFSQARVLTYVLQGVAPGPARIGPVTVELAGGTRSTEPIDVTVVPGSVLPSRRAAADPFDRMMDQDPFDRMFGRQPSGREAKIFVEVKPSRTRVHVGEPVLLTYYLYTQAAVTGLNFDKAPQFPGFWAEDLKDGDRSPEGELVVRDGERYRRYPVFRKLLYPTRAGDVEIPAASLKIGVPRRAGFPFAAAGLGDGVVVRSTEPLRIDVEALPKSEGFDGAVGRFEVSGVLDHDTVTLGEAATFRFTLKGQGNFTWIDHAPELAVQGAKIYPPQVKSAVESTTAGLRGSKTWEYVVVPETPGTLEVPPVQFAYFDTARDALVRLRTSAAKLRVVGAAAPAAAATRVALPADVRLRSAPDGGGGGLGSLGAGLLLGLVVLVSVAHAALWAGARVPRRRSGGATGPTPRRAIAELRRCTRGDLTKEAAAAVIERTIVEVLGEPGEQGTSERDREVAAILREVRFVRYAPQLGEYSEKIRELAGRGIEAVRRWA